MAILETDGIHNSLGSVVHYNRKGKKVMRLKPANYVDPKSPKQLFHREKVRLAGQFTATCKRFLNIGYQDAPEAMDNSSNEARSYILKNCFDTSGELPALDYSIIPISRGLIAAPVITSVTTENGLLTITWKTPVKGDGTRGNDRVMIMFYTSTGAEAFSYYYPDVATRSAGSVSVAIPTSSSTLHCWVFFHNPNVEVGESRSKVSGSVYVGVSNLAYYNI